jgi:hypothetical protein
VPAWHVTGQLYLFKFPSAKLNSMPRRYLPTHSNFMYTIKRRKANWIGQILLRNCLLKHGIEGKLEGRREMTG